MTTTELLHQHRQQCQECKRVQRGESPFCSAATVLEIMAQE